MSSAGLVTLVMHVPLQNSLARESAIRQARASMHCICRGAGQINWVAPPNELE
jgi:hypothetical protein